MDRGFFEGQKPGKRGSGTAQKKVVIALSKHGKKEVPMFLQEQEVSDPKAKTLQVFVAAYMQKVLLLNAMAIKPIQA